jgi:hypothetical protein
MNLTLVGSMELCSICPSVADLFVELCRPGSSMLLQIAEFLFFFFFFLNF